MQLMPTKKYITKLLLNCLLIVGLSLLLLLPAIKEASEKYTHNRLVTVSNLDFKIPAPSAEQVKTIENMSSVDKVFPFYDTFASIQIDTGKTLKENFVLIVPVQYKDEFPFSSHDLLIKGKGEIKAGSVFVDYSFSKKNKVDIDTKLEISIGNMTKKFSVSGIVLNFSDLLSSPETQENVVLLYIDENELSSYTEKNVPYSGAYVRCNNEESFKLYLASYRPYGRMRQRDSFGSDQDYDDYVEYFNNGQYDAEILDLEIRNKLNTSNDSLKLSLIFAVLTFCVTFILNVLIINDKSLIHNSTSLIQNGQEYFVIKRKIEKLLMFLLSAGIVASIGMIFLFVANLSDYYSAASLLPVVLIAVVLPLLLGCFFVFVLSSIAEKRNKTIFGEIKDTK